MGRATEEAAENAQPQFRPTDEAARTAAAAAPTAAAAAAAAETQHKEGKVDVR